ncbi:MAG: hypothetical protein IJU05_00395 [Schwartzia sp.]|nr:hypothetical protein [Schwartzia sp. (in: firmicutes)]
MTIDREKAQTTIMVTIMAAMADNDYLTLARLYARLSSKTLDSAIAEAFTKAIEKAKDVELAMAAKAAERMMELREATEARLA